MSISNVSMFVIDFGLLKVVIKYRWRENVVGQVLVSRRHGGDCLESNVHGFHWK
jgi:hypothetical protein